MPYKVHFISLGCAKNVVNCEQMMALCRQAGHILQPEPEGADAVVVNTCGFLSSANEEAIGHILQMGRLKARGQIGRILVTGCMTQRYGEDVSTELPEVDGILGTGSYKDIVPALDMVMAGGHPRYFDDINALWTNLAGCSPPPAITPTCALPRGATTGAPSASSPSCGGSTAAAPWTGCWRRPGRWPGRGCGS